MFPRFIVSLALSTSLTTAPVLADITPDDAWNIWQAQAKAFGLTLDANETRDGEDLQIGEITVTATLPENIASASFSFDGPRFSPDGNGAVTVMFPTEMKARINVSFNGISDLGATFLIARNNESVVMSGTPKTVTSHWASDGQKI
jgi:hypothetical protein